MRVAPIRRAGTVTDIVVSNIIGANIIGGSAGS
jgi:hypothetical protein